MHTEIVLLACAYLEVLCYDYWLPENRRHWVVRRTVDYSRICLQ